MLFFKKDYLKAQNKIESKQIDVKYILNKHMTLAMYMKTQQLALVS